MGATVTSATPPRNPTEGQMNLAVLDKYWDTHRATDEQVGVIEKTKSLFAKLEDNVIELMIDKGHNHFGRNSDAGDEGFGENSKIGYSIMRLLFAKFFEEFGQFTVLHVSFSNRLDQANHRFKWTHEHLLNEKKVGFLIINECRVISFRLTVDNTVIFRDTGMDVDDPFPGFWEFLRRSNIFEGKTIVVDQETVKHDHVGSGESMSMVNVLLTDDCYASIEDGSILKLPYLESVYAMMVRTEKTPAQLSCDDWRHSELGLVAPWVTLDDGATPGTPPRRRRPTRILVSPIHSKVTDGSILDDAQACDVLPSGHKARDFFKIRMENCLTLVYTGAVTQVMKLYFQNVLENIIEDANAGSDLDDMDLYRDLRDQLDLVENAGLAYRNFLEYPEEDMHNFQYRRHIKGNCENLTEDDRVQEAISFLRGTDIVENMWVDALETYCTRILDLPTEHQWYFALLLIRSWVERLGVVVANDLDGMHGPAMHTLGELQMEDPFYDTFNQELEHYEVDMWKCQAQHRPLMHDIVHPSTDDGDDVDAIALTFEEDRDRRNARRIR